MLQDKISALRCPPTQLSFHESECQYAGVCGRPGHMCMQDWAGTQVYPWGSDPVLRYIPGGQVGKGGNEALPAELQTL